MRFSLAFFLLASTSAGIVAGHWRLFVETAAALQSAGSDLWLIAIPAVAVALAVTVIRVFN